MVEPRTVVLEYPARWQKPRIDLGELAKLRKAGWRTRELSAHFGVGMSAIKMAYAKLRGHASHPPLSREHIEKNGDDDQYDRHEKDTVILAEDIRGDRCG